MLNAEFMGVVIMDIAVVALAGAVVGVILAVATMVVAVDIIDAVATEAGLGDIHEDGAGEPEESEEVLL